MKYHVMNWLGLLQATAAFLCLSLPSHGTAAEAARTDWLSQAGWGVMTHYLGAAPSSAGGAELTAEAWNAQIDAFDVEGLAE